MTGTPGHERTYCRDMVSWKMASFELPCVVWYLLEGKGSPTGCTKAARDNNMACDAIFDFLQRLVCDNKLFTPLCDAMPFVRSDVVRRLRRGIRFRAEHPRARRSLRPLRLSFSEFVSPFLRTLKHVKDWASPVVRNSRQVARVNKQKIDRRSRLKVRNSGYLKHHTVILLKFTFTWGFV